MRIPEVFDRSDGPLISFEVYPPRTEKAHAALKEALPRLAALDPAYLTVTYGAMGSTRDASLEIAARIRGDIGVETASHLTCVGATRAEIDEVLDRLARAGIENIVALRGDPPQGESEFVAPEGGFSHASELVSHLRERGGFGIAVAGYPEKHVEAPDLESDIGWLAHKIEAGADCVITQLFFDNEPFHRFVERLRERGVEVPIVPGLLPIHSTKQLRTLTGMCGASIPPELEERLARAGEDAEAVRQVGTEWSTAQAKDLLERGAPGIHFYVLNRAEPIERILSELRRVAVL